MTSQAVARALVESPSARLSLSSGDSGEQGEDYLAERAALLLLLQLPSAWPSLSWPSPEAAAQWTALMDITGFTIVATEVRGYIGRLNQHPRCTLSAHHSHNLTYP